MATETNALIAQLQATITACQTTLNSLLSTPVAVPTPTIPTTPVVVPVPVGQGRVPENPVGALAGLYYKYYEGQWRELPDFSKLVPGAAGTTSVPNLEVRKRDDYFGLVFTGYISVPADGDYTFYTVSDDGSQLLIGDQLVVDNNKLQGPTEKQGTIALQKGLHAITVKYFEYDGGQTLATYWSGPKLNKQAIAAGSFFWVSAAVMPATVSNLTAKLQ